MTIGSRERRAVIYPMSEKLRVRGRSLINWVTVLGQQMASDRPGTWDRRAVKERFFAQFEDWNFDWIPFADLVAGTQKIYEYPKDDRDPLPRWSFGRVTLLGDAAHPMRPIGSQAGSQAIVDARVLALALATAPSIEDGLAAYERERLPVMNKVILLNREFGPSIIMDMVEQRAPNGFTDIETVIPRHELDEIALSFKVAAGFDPMSLNKRPSLNVRAPLRDVPPGQTQTLPGPARLRRFRGKADITQPTFCRSLLCNTINPALRKFRDLPDVKGAPSESRYWGPG